MPPYRQPTPSPPPPPVHIAPSSTMAAIMAPPLSAVSDAAVASAPAPTTRRFEVPPNFVPPPPPREVATGVANLGNTCYMNAALQALAHAPELCHALDAESHLRRCPVALRNERRRRKRRAVEQAASLASKEAAEDGGSDQSAAGEQAGGPDQQGQGADASQGEGGSQSNNSRSTTPQPRARDPNTGKFHRRSNSNSSNGSSGSKGRRKKTDGSGGSSHDHFDPEYEYCTLCEVERLLTRVHSRPEETLDDILEEEETIAEIEYKKKFGSGEQAAPPAPPAQQQDGPFVPETFVSGFMSKVAPWFRRGVQEDSHEFLRLLIDAMQTSCKGARGDDENEGAAAAGGDNDGDDQDVEYPFRLFRGTVESNVKCSACRSTSCKVDPIEDIGLDILPLKSAAAPGGTGGGRGSRSASPNMAPGPAALADVQQALERFISSEHLDSGYKCEKCGKLGKATKTSKLASIPPILTLHLKRFRYGAGAVGGLGGGSKRGGGVAVNYCEDGGGSSMGTGRSSTRSARGGGRGSGGDAALDFDNIGPSGSAKIEGHVGFGPVLDMRPYLTGELQKAMRKTICRLFAVVVHSGKNSHSGHYVAYVHNVTKRNEWWKMDDGKVLRSSWDEVRNAEAYMLFYRVTAHPVAIQLKSLADAKEEKARRVVEEIRRREEAAKAAEEARKADAVRAAKAAAAALQDLVESSAADDKVVPDAAPSSDNEDGAPSSPGSSSPPVPLGKRQRPPLASGEEWAHAVTTLSAEFLPLFTRIQEYITDNVTFNPEFFGYITEEYNRMSSKLSIGRRVKNNKRIKTLLGKGPGGVYPPDDVVGGAEDFQEGIMDLFHQIAMMYKMKNKGSGNSESFLIPGKKLEEAGVKVEGDSAAKDEEKLTTKAAEETPADVVPGSPELLIPQDSENCFDGAL